MTRIHGEPRDTAPDDSRPRPWTLVVLLVGLCLAVVVTACGGGGAASTNTTSVPPSTSTPSHPSSEPALPNFGKAGTSDFTNSDKTPPKEDILAKFQVQNGNLGKLEGGKDEPQYRDAFNLWTQLVPANDRTAVSVFAVYSKTGPNADSAGYVTLNDTNSSWIFAVNESAPNRWDLADTLIHETFHTMSLAGQQTNIAIPPGQCPINPDVGAGCPTPGSYLATYISRYWPAPLAQEWQQATASNSIATFYKNHAGDFVREYAATNPREDIAETFAAWVLGTPGVPAGVVQKEQFFQAYPQLVELKNYAQSHGLKGLNPPPSS